MVKTKRVSYAGMKNVWGYVYIDMQVQVQVILRPTVSRQSVLVSGHFFYYCT
jgi:hypothetical protein